MAKNHWHTGKTTGARAEAYKYAYKSGLELTVSNSIIESEYELKYETETVNYIVPERKAKYKIQLKKYLKPAKLHMKIMLVN